MRRRTGLPLILLALVLAACQQQPRPEELPLLREAALGETLTLTAPVENWPAGQVAEVRLEGQPIGRVSAQGLLTVSTDRRPSTLSVPQETLLRPVPLAGQERRCRMNTVTASDPAARVSGLDALDLGPVPVPGQGLQPQLSPVPPTPQLWRTQGEDRTLLVYADRDVRLRGRKDCVGSHWYGVQPEWTQTSSIHLQLRRGWNTVTVTASAPAQDRFVLTVQGGEAPEARPWQYSGVPLGQPR
ncbi:hypothetical protein F8S09_05365 [Deinococcus sp. SDU3-2]|uniref:Lipoprotein n=1 Tax=Deinococcus terrestris TaxID=2651870 RepID=A0A7X1NUN4_9DEIO|nr:hypothetical protein [Deinococcus terrestris]MPY66127.1 hypothetical protein [Deinococcus terrestris]